MKTEIDNDKEYSRIVNAILAVKNKILKLFEEGENKANLHKLAKEELCECGIGFPQVGESYKQMIDRAGDEGSSFIFPNGTAPYEELFEFFGLTIK